MDSTSSSPGRGRLRFGRFAEEALLWADRIETLLDGRELSRELSPNLVRAASDPQFAPAGNRDRSGSA